jgi:hypothetical protein
VSVRLLCGHHTDGLPLATHTVRSRRRDRYWCPRCRTLQFEARKPVDDHARGGKMSDQPQTPETEEPGTPPAPPPGDDDDTGDEDEATVPAPGSA